MIFPDYWSEDRLGEALIAAGAMTPDDWERALVEVRGAKLQIGPALDALGWVAEKDLCAIVVGAFRVPYLPENLCRPDPGALSVLPNDTLRQTSVLPLARFGDALTIAIPGFLRTEQLEEIQRSSGCTPMPLVALPSVVRTKVKEVLEGKRESVSSGPIDFNPSEDPPTPVDPGTVHDLGADPFPAEEGLLGESIVIEEDPPSSSMRPATSHPDVPFDPASPAG